MGKPQITVARYIEQQLALCGRPQKEIAAECGYGTANIITMFKQGTTKVPLEKVGLLAAALQVDVTYLFRLVMTEYMPASWAALESIFGPEKFITANELAVAKFIRKIAGGNEIDLTDKDNARELLVAIECIADHDQAKADAAVAAQNRLPPNARHKR